ncbi:PepSY domain-containing protein [Rhodoplanes serenus]|uniref:PepSY domain-containing protein n=1 Tax=Rhodoplanes serenus TaxID=200615 RepID=UPI000DABF87E|nr:hypothetical protein [Rhodoplanes serenus]RAI31959.1 hypothetical protein CH340_17010 [Rhodoplanes serenus]
MTRQTIPVAFGIVLAAVGVGLDPAGAADPVGAAEPEARTQAAATPATGAEAAVGSAGLRCLSRAEQRTRSAANTVVPLAKAAEAVKARRGELLRARLCEQNGRLVYILTVLPRGGKLVRATVDAGTGTLVSAK